jgi:hypothetical protein
MMPVSSPGEDAFGNPDLAKPPRALLFSCPQTPENQESREKVAIGRGNAIE